MIGLIISFLLVFVFIPIYWALTTSLKPDSDIQKGTLGLSGFTLSHYSNIFQEALVWGSFMGTNVTLPLRNSIIVALATTVVSLFVGALAAYGLTMLPIRGRDFISMYVLFAYVFPPFILIVPLSILLKRLGLLDTLTGLGLSHLIITVPFVTWMIRGYFMTIPGELRQAALVDGCSELGALGRVVLPVAAPGIVTAAIFSFTNSWSELLFALVIVTRNEYFTLPLSATMMAFGDIFRWGELMAIAIVSMIPPTLLYMLIQRYLVKGLMAGAVKG